MRFSPLQVIIGCECSGVIRRAVAELGHIAISVDLKPAEDGAPRAREAPFCAPWDVGSPIGYHYQGDLFQFLEKVCGPRSSGAMADFKFHLGIFHPDCTYLANSGVQWLSAFDSLPGARALTGAPRWAALESGLAFYQRIRDLPIEHKAIENPVMHGYAIARLPGIKRQIVQPWMFGDKMLKATGWELFNLPPLVPTSTLRPPSDPAERKKWAIVHNAAPTKDPEVRKANRSRTPPNSGYAYAQQWCSYVQKERVKKLDPLLT